MANVQVGSTGDRIASALLALYDDDAADDEDNRDGGRPDTHLPPVLDLESVIRRHLIDLARYGVLRGAILRA